MHPLEEEIQSIIAQCQAGNITEEEKNYLILPLKKYSSVIMKTLILLLKILLWMIT
jgi:hypothetical protein